jgi:site-specific recombinase XerD
MSISGQGIVAVVDPEPLARYAGQARRYAAAAKSQRTLTAYGSDWVDFDTFCRSAGQGSLPAAPETVALYLTWLVDECKRKTSTLARRIAAISQVHQVAGFPTPTGESVVRAVMAGIRRVHGSEQTAKTALSPELLGRLVGGLPDTVRGLRDRALLLVGFAAALRRSELVALEMRDVAFESEGVVLLIRRSKTDPEAAGHLVGIPFSEHAETCPVRALQTWLTRSRITDGPVFRPIERWSNIIQPRPLEDRRVATLLKELVKRAGLEEKTFCGALAPQRPRHCRGRRRRQRARHHGSDATPVCQTGPPLHPARIPVPRQRQSVHGGLIVDHYVESGDLVLTKKQEVAREPEGIWDSAKIHRHAVQCMSDM